MERGPAAKPDFILKAKDGERLVRIGGMWSDGKGGFKITLDEGIEVTSTKEDRFKAFAFVNDWDDKHPEAKK